MSLVSTMLKRAQRESDRMLTRDWEFRRIRIQRFYLPRALSALSFPLRLVLAAILIALLAALKPFVQIRFLRLHSSTLGLFSVPVEVYLCEVDAGMHPKKALDVFYHYESEHMNRSMVKVIKPKDAVCNEQLDKMLGRKLRVYDAVRPLGNLVRMLPSLGSEFVGDKPPAYAPAHEGLEKGNEYLSRQEDL